MSDGSENDRDQTVKSVRRTVEVLELFASSKGSLSAGEIRQRLALPQSSTSVLLNSLGKLGYLTFDAESRRWEPTIRLNLLGAWMQIDRLSGVNLEDLMQRVNDLTGAAVLLGMENGLFVRYVHIIQSKAPMRLHFTTGTERPICRAAAGKVLLTQKSESEIASIVKHYNTTSGASRISVSQLMQDLERCRSQGYCLHEGTNIKGVGAFAMLLPSIYANQPVSIAVCGLLDDLKSKWKLIRETLMNELGQLQKR